jgi:hypothetical protein
LSWGIGNAGVGLESITEIINGILDIRMLPVRVRAFIDFAATYMTTEMRSGA